MENNHIEIKETKEPFIQEHKVGARLYFGEHELEVLCHKNQNCANCFFRGILYYCRDIICAACERNDRKNVIFKEIKEQDYDKRRRNKVCK